MIGRVDISLSRQKPNDFKLFDRFKDVKQKLKEQFNEVVAEAERKEVETKRKEAENRCRDKT